MTVRICMLVIVLWAATSLLAPVFELDTRSVQLERMLAPPGRSAMLGHDELGRSVAARMVAGSHTSFVVAISVVLVSVLVGTVIGCASAWYGGALDHVVTRVIDVFLAFPGILLAIALAGILGPGIENVVFALSVVGWVGFARLARAQTLSLKHREHVLAAVALGARAPAILIRHVVPLIAAPLIVEATFAVAGVIVGEAGLSYLGLGVQPPDASWGSIIREGTGYMLVAPHLVMVPAVALSAVVLAINLLGDRLRDHLDVRQD